MSCRWKIKGFALALAVVAFAALAFPYHSGANGPASAESTTEVGAPAAAPEEADKAGEAAAPDVAEAPATIAEAFLGEELTYHLGFWLFTDAADARVALMKGAGEGTYVATLEAQTTGVIGFFLKYRKDTYTSTMRLSEDGTRFITETFEKRVDKGGEVRKGIRTVDYEEGVVRSRSWGGGSPEKTEEQPIPEGQYVDDPLAAFYNFRYGAYGPLVEGGDYRILTFPREDGTDPYIELNLASHEGKLDRYGPEPEGTLADVSLDPDLFDSKSGDVEIIFDSGTVPVYAVAKDIAFFGDVWGDLTGYGAAVGFTKTAPRTSPEMTPDTAPIEGTGGVVGETVEDTLPAAPPRETDPAGPLQGAAD